VNVLHAAVVRMIRERVAADGNPLGATFAEMTDTEIVRVLFASYREGGADGGGRGLRLTAYGLQIMKCYFHAYEVRLPEGHRIKAPHLLYLDRRASLPYHYSAECLVVFESKLGIKLKLADGDIATLIEMDRTPE
jgi:hypothetical protein